MESGDKPDAKIRERLKEHKAWLDSDQRRGTRLSDERFDLTGLDFRGFDMPRVRLKGGDLTATDFRDADLSDADLSHTTGLQAHRLGGANVSNTKLPDHINKFDLLGVIDKASQNARKLFLTMLVGCVYSMITIATTTDLRLILNTATSRLPIIGADVPILYFYWAGPAFLIGIYVYFHLGMQRLWESLANLPAIFPDGQSLDEKAYPWLLLGLVRAQLQRLRENRPPFSRMQEFASIFLAWWAVPLTLYAYWVRAIPRHDAGLTGWHVLLLLVSLGWGQLTYRQTVRTLRIRDRFALNDFLNKDLIDDFKIHHEVRRGLGRFVNYVTAVSIAAVIMVGYLSYFAVVDTPALGRVEFLGFQPYGFRPYAQLGGEELSRKPIDWNANPDTSRVVGVDLSGRDLRRAFLRDAFLVGANLQDADLSGAFLNLANLASADLSRANLTRAWLHSADLTGATLNTASLNLAGCGALTLPARDLPARIFPGWNFPSRTLPARTLEARS